MLLRLGTDQRSTFLRTSKYVNTPVETRGIQLGVVLHGRHSVGLGFYNLRSTSEHIEKINGEDVNVFLNFRYLTAYYEYFFIKTRWWRIGIQVEAGIGMYSVDGNVVKDNQKISFLQERVYPLGAGLDVNFKPTPRWLALHVMGGYRYVLHSRSAPNPVDLNNWFYSVGVSVYLREVLQDGRYYLKKKAYKKHIATLRH